MQLRRQVDFPHRLASIRAAVAVMLGLCTFGARDAAAQGRGGPPSLPPQASSQAEEQHDGTLEVSIEDAATSARLVHFLWSGNQRLKLEFDSEPPDLPNGASVRARGRRQDDTLRLSSRGDVQALAALPTSNTFGEQKVAVILINFTDKTDVPYDWTTAYNVTFGSTSDFYREASYGQTWLTGNVYGWFTIPATSTTCDYNLFRQPRRSGRGRERCEPVAVPASHLCVSADRRLHVVGPGQRRRQPHTGMGQRELLPQGRVA